MKHRVRGALRFFVYFLVVFGFAAVHWFERKFGNVALEQFLYHAFEAETLALTADESLVSSFLKNVILAPVLAAGLFAWADGALSNKVKSKLPRGNTVPRLAWNGRMPTLATVTILFLMSEVSAFSYIADQVEDSSYFAEQYLPFEATRIVPREPRNLILIYLESIEATYSDAALFERDLLRPLNELPGLSFADFQQVPGTSWTTGGLVGTQCGVPLKNVFSATSTDEKTENRELNRLGKLFAQFLPRATCLGDILAQQGYRSTFIGGASSLFAGKGTFLREHGYDEVFGREELLAAGLTDELNAWGFHDDAVFAFAKRKVSELHSAGQPFNLTLLSVDTHGPDGFVSPTCAARGAEDFAAVVSCTAEQTAEFVGFLDEAGYLADTRVVIIGDHLAMRNPVTDRLQQAPERTIFNRFIGHDLPAPNRETIVHFDLLPSILHVLGMPVEGGRLGLGYSGFDEQSPTPPVDRLLQLREHLPKRSSAYAALWHAHSL